MPKPRTKRGADRDERKRKRRGEEETSNSNVVPKRQRTEDETDETRSSHQQDYPTEEYHERQQQQDGTGEKEFFGMLADEEQEYFRRADEMLELNQFPASEERDIFLESVFKEAQGKELKLASSQSCSRLMERLIQLSNTRQKKHLFDAFGGHFLSLVQHRFASHCCEALFLRSAGVVTQELAGFTMDTKEGNLSFLITDRFASHTLRVLLLVLSGRSLDDASVKTLMKSKKKENISVAGSAAADEQNKGLRAVPNSFTLAVQKIIADSTAGVDSTGLRVLARHPIGNPTLQLLFELDMTVNKTDKKSSEASESEPAPPPSLLQQLLPGAPKSLSDPASEASEFINGMIYDQIGSRLIETLVAHCPGKVFKQLNHNFFLPRIEGYVRNDISCYPAIKVLNRIGKDDLITAADKIAPTVPQLVSKTRYNVLRSLFDRCSARGINDQIKKLIKGLKEGCGPRPADLVTTLCHLSEPTKSKEALTRNEYAVQAHGASLLTTLLSIPGPLKAVHESILGLTTPQLLRLANASMPTVTLLTTALATPSQNSLFQKSLVATLCPHTSELSTSQFGHNLINSIAEIPSKGKDLSIPLHVKESMMQHLATQEATLRESWMGRSVWRAWKGDVWKTRRSSWKAWMKETDAQTASVTHASAQGKKHRQEQRG
ncbi:Nucleolar protein 9 [Metarhizium rileyi]|uniref:Nucleolar protein 9 n=1 Tax=Metarhizium rileyi (strain RCEF 4871) TaxID=1649241 RepID=A0A5C6GKB1_METRR|nr:Nucleolar protein 9 [Metarhizium rileyi]